MWQLELWDKMAGLLREYGGCLIDYTFSENFYPWFLVEAKNHSYWPDENDCFFMNCIYKYCRNPGRLARYKKDYEAYLSTITGKNYPTSGEKIHPKIIFNPTLGEGEYLSYPTWFAVELQDALLRHGITVTDADIHVTSRDSRDSIHLPKITVAVKNNMVYPQINKVVEAEQSRISEFWTVDTNPFIIDVVPEKSLKLYNQNHRPIDKKARGK